MDLSAEAEHATGLLKGKVVSRVVRHGAGEVGVEFTDGTRLFIDCGEDGAELSITGGDEDE